MDINTKKQERLSVAEDLVVHLSSCEYIYYIDILFIYLYIFFQILQYFCNVVHNMIFLMYNQKGW